MSPPPMINLSAVIAALKKRRPTDPMPVAFIGHGSPMNAIQDTAFSAAWNDLGPILPRPSAILCVSAHWLTEDDTRVSLSPSPETIHDFSGFPRQLYEQHYPAPGAPAVARQVMDLITTRSVVADEQRGLDHGAWVVLIRMFPAGDIPVFQLSLDYRMRLRDHYQMARALAPLRERGVLILGSGNLVHNLRAMRGDGPPYDWAFEFDRRMTESMDRGDDAAVVDFRSLGDLARLAHPTWDHFLPLIYVLAQRRPGDTLHYFNTGFDLASISMRSLLLF